MNTQPLTEAQNEKIFRSKILPDFNESLQPSASAVPVLLYVAGQGGAGKSTSIDRAREIIKGKHGSVLLLQRDLLRDYFPGYKEQLRIYGAEGYKISEEDTWKWYEKLKTEAINRRASLVVETTFRKKGDILADIERFTNAGYDVGARILAVHPEITAVATFTRYEKEIAETGIGRAVDPQTHKASVTGLQSTLRALEERGDIAITLQDRDGFILAEPSPTSYGRASQVLRQVHQTLTQEDAEKIKSAWGQVLESMQRRSAPSHEIKQVQSEMDQAIRRVRAQSLRISI